MCHKIHEEKCQLRSGVFGWEELRPYKAHGGHQAHNLNEARMAQNREDVHFHTMARLDGI